MDRESRKVWNVGDTAGTPRTRALAAALRAEMQRSGRTVREIGRQLDRSHTTISQWQSGKRVPSTDDVAALLAVLRVTGKRRTEILGLARNAHERNWLAVGMSQHLDGLVECERTAGEIFDWCPMVISGLLQTPDYAAAIIAGDDSLSRHEVEARVRVRIERGTRLRQRSDRCDHVVLLGEHVLQQMIGGPKVFADQLRGVLKLGERTDTTIQLVFSGHSWHAGLIGPFVLYNFFRTPSIVSAENHRSSAFLYEEVAVSAYKRAVGKIRNLALEPEESAELLRNRVKELEATS